MENSLKPDFPHTHRHKYGTAEHRATERKKTQSENFVFHKSTMKTVKRVEEMLGDSCSGIELEVT